MVLSRTRSSRLLTALLAIGLLAALVVPGPSPDAASAAEPVADASAATASGFLLYVEDAVLVGLNVSENPYYVTGDAGSANFTFNGVPEGATLTGRFVGTDGSFQAIGDVTNTDGDGSASFTFDEATPTGELTLEILVDDDVAGSTRLFHNVLEATMAVDGEDLEPGDDLTLTGVIEQLDVMGSDLVGVQRTGVPATFDIVLRTPDGTTTTAATDIVAADGGTFTATVPGSATASLAPVGDELTLTIALDAVDATYDDAGTPWSATRAGTAPVTLGIDPDRLQLDNSFVSATGWVKPGDTFPFRVSVTNAIDAVSPASSVSLTAPDGVRFRNAVPLGDAPAATVTPETITWPTGTVPAGTPDAPTTRTLVVEAEAVTLADDPELVWKDLSVTATLTEEGENEATSTTHGPKVIPPSGGFETARYGDKPFPMIPAEYVDRKHRADHTGAELFRVVNDPDFDGSMFNLYQEMSYGQIFPQGAVPSADIASATYDADDLPRFTSVQDTNGTCRGATLADVPGAVGSPVMTERIVDGWYQLPGNTEYYGGDFPAFTLGTGSTIDAACGPTGKSVYDAAAAADLDIDYNDFDSDRDGVVDFFMLVFVGCGGNGSSQLSVAGCDLGPEPYDNIWPHSSSLEFAYRDEATGLRGYLSDDQLTSLLGVPQCFTDASRTSSTDCAANGGAGDDAFPVPVRVGPYNVNPEDAIDAASVISHEYGHHLGLPDFYSGGATASPYYDSMNLMASDYSQNMTIFGKQDLGWVVPDVVQPGETVDVDDWAEIKTNTGEIRWETPDGTPYTLSETNGDQNVRNGQAYTLKLPGRVLLEDGALDEGASPPNVLYSGRGNDFGCSPTGGHNVDVNLDGLLEDVEPGTPITLEYASSWDIEWDWDYGFTLVTTDGAEYASLPSLEGYTTDNAYNPNDSGCQGELNNGLTGQSGAYEAGEPAPTLARNPAQNDYSAATPFLTDRYDLSDYAGEKVARVRLSYFTDAAFDRPGWFVDDLRVIVGEGDDAEVLVETDFDDDGEGLIFQGGCDGDLKVAAQCTDGWSSVQTGVANPADHAYYLELRDRSSFDFEGRGQSDRGIADWQPGILLEYTDEDHGYGNNGLPAPPAQHYLDSVPEPGAGCDTTACEDSAFQAVDGRNRFSDASADPHVDNHSDPSTESGNWVFDHDCLTLDVTDASLVTNLVADATITAGEGCREFSYAEPLAAGNTAPTARVQTKKREVAVDEPITVDASASTDQQDAAGDMTFAWDLDDDGSFDDASGGAVTTTFDDPGDHRVRVRVTDTGGLTDTAGTTVRVVEGDAPGGGTVDPPTTPTDPDASEDRVERIDGADRVDTAVRLSRRGFDRADTAVVASSLDFPDALTASTLAAEVDGPVLLTPPDGLDERVARELERLGVDDVYLVGGELALDRSVEEALATNATTTRLAGADRFATAARIAEEVVTLGGPVDGAILAVGAREAGDAWPDALAAGPLAIEERWPVLLTRPGAAPTSTTTALADLLDAGDELVVAGGPLVVTQALADRLADDLGMTARRVAGADRFATSVAFADAALAAGVDDGTVVLASGRRFPDALAAGPVTSQLDAPLLLLEQDEVPEPVADWLDAHAGDTTLAVLVGGPVALDSDLDADVLRRIR